MASRLDRGWVGGARWWWEEEEENTDGLRLLYQALGFRFGQREFGCWLSGQSVWRKVLPGCGTEPVFAESPRVETPVVVMTLLMPWRVNWMKVSAGTEVSLLVGLRGRAQVSLSIGS